MPKNKGKKQTVREKIAQFESTGYGKFKPSWGPVVLPDVMHVRMMYNDFRQYTCAANVAERVFRLNSIFDPDQTLGGGLATGYTEWATLFLNYRVVACRWRVEMTGSGNGANGLLVVVANQAAAALATSSAAVIEASGIRKFASAKSQAAGGPICVLSQIVPIAELFGVVPSTVYTDNNFQSGFGNNPAFQGYLHVMVNDQANATGVVDIRVMLEYFVRLEGPVSAGVETLSKSAANFRNRLDDTCRLAAHIDDFTKRDAEERARQRALIESRAEAERMRVTQGVVSYAIPPGYTLVRIPSCSDLPKVPGMETPAK